VTCSAGEVDLFRRRPEPDRVTAVVVAGVLRRRQLGGRHARPDRRPPGPDTLSQPGRAPGTEVTECVDSHSSLPLRTPYALDAPVSREQVRFEWTPETVCTGRWVPDKIRERVL